MASRSPPLPPLDGGRPLGLVPRLPAAGEAAAKAVATAGRRLGVSGAGVPLAAARGPGWLRLQAS